MIFAVKYNKETIKLKKYSKMSIFDRIPLSLFEFYRKSAFQTSFGFDEITELA